MLFVPFLLSIALGGDSLPAGFATVTEKDLLSHVGTLAGPQSEGRDSPSTGLEHAALYLAERFAAAGVACAPDALETWRAYAGDVAPVAGPAGDPRCTYLRPFTRQLPRPVAEGSRLELADGPEARAFQLGVDFVPVAGFEGEARGELVFAGYGIDASSESYNDLAGLTLRGEVALILEGEPAHPRRFEGPEVSPEASLWQKLERIAETGVAGVLVARRPREGVAEDAPLGFRHTWAEFVGGGHRAPPLERMPVLEVTEACASALLGEDVRALAERIDRRMKPVRAEGAARTIAFAGRTETADVRIDNVVGWIAGSDPTLAGEVVVVGAHYDHVGVDTQGRIGHGADDNASGTAALLEIAEALAASPPRRSVAVCAFAAEEDGLVGSQAFCQRPPVPIERVVAMINMDMVGRGDRGEVAVIGVRQNPGLEDVLKRAQKLGPTGVKKLVLRGGEELFQRSDHYSFHEKGVPALFFFEGLPISRNKDYHTWRDTIDQLDFEKIHNTTRLVLHTAWILATDDGRPPRPPG